jgi:hypothetical protein
LFWKNVSMKSFHYLDEYDFRARFVPAIITTLPIITAIIALFPAARQLYGLLIGPALEAVLVLVLVRVARDEGKRIEPRLLNQWDGLPTTRYLRHRNVELEKPTRERYKASLAKLTGLSFPSAEDEARDPHAAEAYLRIGDCSFARAKTRKNVPARIQRKLQLRDDAESARRPAHRDRHRPRLHFGCRPWHAPSVHVSRVGYFLSYRLRSGAGHTRAFYHRGGIEAHGRGLRRRPSADMSTIEHNS